MPSMQDKVALLRTEIEAFAGSGPADAEQFRLRYISKKGSLSLLFEELRSVPADHRKEAGRVLNELKQFAETKYRQLSDQGNAGSASGELPIDLTLPPAANKVGNLHPLTLT